MNNEPARLLILNTGSTINFRRANSHSYSCLPHAHDVTSTRQCYIYYSAWVEGAGLVLLTVDQEQWSSSALSRSCLSQSVRSTSVSVKAKQGKFLWIRKLTHAVTFNQPRLSLLWLQDLLSKCSNVSINCGLLQICRPARVLFLWLGRNKYLPTVTDYIFYDFYLW